MAEFAQSLVDADVAARAAAAAQPVSRADYAGVITTNNSPQPLTGAELIDAVCALADAPRALASYTHEAMVSLMIAQPDASHAQLAAHFGRQASWLSSVLASDGFQQALDPRRHEVLNPEFTATMEERFRALSIRSVTVLQDKLNSSGVSDLVVLKGAEIGIKALGMGNPQPVAPTPLQLTGANAVAEKLMAAMAKMRLQSGNAGAEDAVIVIDAND